MLDKRKNGPYYKRLEKRRKMRQKRKKPKQTTEMAVRKTAKKPAKETTAKETTAKETTTKTAMETMSQLAKLRKNTKKILKAMGRLLLTMI